MTRAVAALAAFVAALVVAPAALAATTFTVNDNGDAPDANISDGICATTVATQCTLRAAIMQANSTGADLIRFDPGGQSPAVATPLPALADSLTIDGGGNTTVTFAPSATGTLLAIQAADSTVKAITLAGGGSGTLLGLGGPGDRADSVTVRNAGGNGVTITAPNATISAPDISGSAGDGIASNSDGASISGGTIHNNGASGVFVSGQNDTVSHVVFYGNGAKPITVASGANGGIAAPQNLRIGPRRADGSLPLTGTASGGTIELWSGDPASANAPGFLDSFSVSGDFTYNFASEPQPGSVFSLSLTSGGVGTSEFASVAVPSDTSSPDVTFARALDTSNVRVDFTEPIDPATAQKEDFKLTMAGLDRPITASSVTPDGRAVILTSSGWKPGEAGFVQFTGVGSVNDSAGNAMLSAPRMRVAAAPGDFFAPLGSRLAVSPKTICLTHARNCRKPGMTITFFSTEAGKATLLIKRSNVTVGKRLYASIVAGKNKLKFNGRLGARKLRAGRYRLLIYVQDQVGNVTPQPPITLFNVRRVSK